MFMKFLVNTLFIICLFFSTNIRAAEKLVFAVDLVRHGDRTPLYEIPHSPYQWRKNLGDLTAIGEKQMFLLGNQFRQKYINHYHLLPESYTPETIYVRSTDIPRTIQSAEALLRGLYPANKKRISIPITVIPKSEDNLLVVKPSKNIFSLAKMYLFKRNIWNEKTNAIQDKINHWSKATGLPINNFPQLDHLADNLYIRKLHHVPLPDGISSDDAEKIISLGEYYLVSELKRPEISYPMGHAFLSTIAQYFKQAAEKTSTLKYAIFLAHDGSIMSVMNTLEIPLNNIPGYGSHLNFSLFESNNHYYIKIYFNNQPVSIPKCNKNTICSLKEFLLLVSQ